MEGYGEAKELILASASQRRRALLENCGYLFTVMPSRAEEESVRADSPGELVERLSLLKAEAVFRSLPAERKRVAVVLGSDTVVTLDGNIIGKPRSGEEAFRMLREESGRANTVYTGLALVALGPDGGPSARVLHDSAEVRFSVLTDDEIAAYVNTGDPMDKAGAYGIQGRFSVHIESVSGSYFTVVGLPVHLVYRELKRFGILPQA